MDSAAEFVEQGRRVVDADQRRLALRGFGEIIIVRCEDVALAAQRLLAAIGRHPRARTLAVAREIVEIEEIGRESCRERVCTYVYISGVAGTLKKKQMKNITNIKIYECK